MSVKSFFDKLRNTALAVGQSERTATRKARLLERALFADFRRLAPAENVKLGLSPKARHYVLSTTKRLTKATPTVSARQFETKRAGALFGLSPEKATEARRQGAISYTSADQRERVAKAGSDARGDEDRRRDKATPRGGRARSEQFAGQAPPRTVLRDHAGRGRALPGVEAAEACRSAHS